MSHLCRSKIADKETSTFFCPPEFIDVASSRLSVYVLESWDRKSFSNLIGLSLVADGRGTNAPEKETVSVAVS